ncbi:MAG: DsbC/DsbD-like thiol-disulfide interchange protein [Sulfitobacter sp.]|jgi:DsbC/DsbD-like thiol-disulfide interchange protein
MIKRFLAALALCCAIALPVWAQDAFEIPVTGEILTGWQQRDGSRVAAIRLTLHEGWKTYWRTPGDAGIPPEFDWSKSDNLKAVKIIWPRPKVFSQSGMRSIGYSHEVVLPLAIAPRTTDKPVTLRAKLDIGVCSDICVPQELTLTAVLDSSSQKPTAVIAAALAARPYSGKDAGVTSAKCGLRPGADGLQITAKLALPDTGGQEVVVIETPNPDLWMSETKASRSGTLLTATARLASVSGGAVAVNRSDLVITVLGKNHAVEIKGCSAD